MKLGTAIAEIMKREGIGILCGYPVNHLIEHAAKADIRPVMVRQDSASASTWRMRSRG
ncbi:thiamine pyrophosphate-dependent acetolactate synthase large subunit-like protein [Bradyrhizobium sp. GM2.4]